MQARVLILYYSRGGATQRLADAIAEGVISEQAEPLLRTVDSDSEAASARDLTIDKNDISDCDALVLGSPTRFGHMASALQRFWESTSNDWLKGSLIDKPGAVFTSTSSLHGGQESTLLSLALPLLHHGMLLTGIPYSEPSLHGASGGGSPYGASFHNHGQRITEHELDSAKALGKRVAALAKRLSAQG